MVVFFDMDGSIVDFYGVDGWLNDLENSNTRPYVEAKPLFNFSSFARLLHRLQNNGIEIGIISWTSKTGTAEYNKAVEEAKKEWLKKHLPSVEFNSIHITEYGVLKNNFRKNKSDILFDDNAEIRKAWGENAFDVGNILEHLKAIA